MRNIKKRFLWIFLLVSLVLILCNFAAIEEFISYRSYTTFSEDELTGMFLSVEFVDGTELFLDHILGYMPLVRFYWYILCVP